MTRVDYSEIANRIPKVWYTKDELRKKIPEVFIRIVLDIAEAAGLHLTKEDKLRKLTAVLSKMSGITPEKIEQELMEVAAIFGRLEIFEEKYPEMVGMLPLTENNTRIYPAIILASILGVSKEKAISLTKGLFEDYSYVMEASEEVLN
ncbi:MAG: hypothetical protein COB67_12265 [SAR324 cluster bacterium]|uniref:Uncharacterized protein n=1 Tax=SAR324 cluster bacterium TaxID=2024889 RepID=A0A2A4SSR2_9DELT|nr:MAG: hypothetical protein COB67_12265 [SAR324 cluster bacterium]